MANPTIQNLARLMGDREGKNKGAVSRSLGYYEDGEFYPGNYNPGSAQPDLSSRQRAALAAVARRKQLLNAYGIAQRGGQLGSGDSKIRAGM